MNGNKPGTKYSLILAGLATAGWPLTSLADVAQDLEVSAANEAVEKITVTSSRRVQSIQDVPAAVSAVNPDEFVKSGLTSISDVIGYTPGYQVISEGGQRGRGSITARGVSQLGGTAVTAIYIDDVPLTSNSSFAKGNSLFFDGLLGDVERVELIKGPQGTLFGATAISGAIRYISREPALFDARGALTADMSATKGGGVNKLYRGFYSLPLVEDRLGITLAGFSADDAGYVDQVDALTGDVIREDANHGENYGYSADMLFDATDKLSLRIKALKQNSSFGMGSAVNIAGLDKQEMYGKLTSNRTFGDENTSQRMLSGSLEYEMDGAVVNFTSSYVKYTSGLAQDGKPLYAPIIEQLTGMTPGSIDTVPVTVDVESKKTTHELRITSTAQGKLEWIAGLYLADESTQNQQKILALPAEIVGLLAAFPSDYKEMAAFGNLTYYLSDDFDLTLGMRYADTELALNYLRDGLLIGASEDLTLPTAEADIQTYLLTARYRPHKDMSLYARVASGYRPASANLSINHPVTGQLLSQPTVDQDNLWSYEIGAKGDWADGLFSYDAALWYIDWQDFQAYASFFGLRTQGNARGGVTARGFEGALTISPSSSFTIKTSMAYSNSTLNEDEPSLFGLAGADLPGVPRWSLSSIARYEFDLSRDTYGWVTAGVRYRDSFPSAFNNGDPTNPTINLDSDDTLLVDMSVGMAWQDLVLNLYVNNLLDADDYASFNAQMIPGTGNMDITGTPVEPRTIGLSATYSF
ncbi:TonB-dependent receptor [Bowmanella denitrificans]|uniref:TonB-dependent receptor n=1 Tax=Bowmanella denitrificans TaxID=366582 RepID=UPI000C9CA8C2|nr:TonB-dependent receptor [Bowmanella denitrificans]